MQRISGLSDEQVLAYEAQAEAALRAALEFVMDKIAKRIEASAPVLASVLVAADAEPPSADPPGQPYVSPDDLASIPSLWQEQVAQQVIPLVAQVFMDAAGRTHANMIDASNITTLPSVGSLAAERHLAQAANTFEQIGDHLWTQARSQLSEGFEAGESIPELAARLRASAGVTARTGVLVARTQVNEASNAGSFAVAQASGLAMKKEWIATPDLRTRPTHLAADGQRVDMAEPFNIGDFSAMYPADPSLPPEERFNCRCTIGYVMPDPAIDKMRENLVQQQAQEELPGTEGPLTQLFPKPAEPAPIVLPARGENPASYVRPSLAAAKTPRQLRKAWQDEVRSITGYPFYVDEMPRGISLVTAREYAEGTLQMFAQFPAARMDRIHWFDDAAGPYAQVRTGGHAIEFNMRYARESARPTLLASRRKDVAGWETGTTSWSVRGDVPAQGVVYHEFTHILDEENLRRAIHPDIVPLLVRHAQAESVTDIDDLIKRRISAYATENYHEMIAEATTDVMVNGAAASQMSQDIFGLLRAEYRRRGFEIRTIAAPEEAGALGEVFPKGTEQAPSVDIRALLHADRAEKERVMRSVYEGQFGKYITRVDSVTPGKLGDEIGVSGIVLDSKGHEIGRFVRSISRSGDEVWAHHAVLELDEKATQGSGFGRIFNDHVVDWYRRSGIDGIYLEARDVGKYVWATQGFDFTPASAEHVFSELDEFLNDLRASKIRDRFGEMIPKRLLASSDLPDQIAQAESILARARSLTPGESGYPSAFEVSQIGRSGQKGKTATWLGKTFMLRTSWDGERKLNAVIPELMPGPVGKSTSAMTIAELRAEMTARGLAIPAKARKADLIKALEAGPRNEIVAEVPASIAPIAPTTIEAPEASSLSRAPLAIQARQDVLREAAARPVLEGQSRRMSGESAYTTKVMHDGGPPTVTKDYSRIGETKAAAVRSADAEELGALVDDAVGLRAPTVIRTGPRSIEQEWLAGPSGEEILPWPHTITDELINSNDGRLMGLSDLLLGDTDRNAGNFIRLEDGRLAPIDRGSAFATAKLAGAKDPFGAQYASGGKWAKSIDINPADLAVIHARLEGLRPEFERLGRGAWHRQVMARLAEIEKRADPNAAIRLAEARPDLAAIKARPEIDSLSRLEAAPTGQTATKAPSVSFNADGEGADRVTGLSGLTEAERERIAVALEDYRGFEFSVINDMLRGVDADALRVKYGAGAVSSARESVTFLDSAFEHSSLREDVALWRAPGSGRGIFGDPKTWGDDLTGFEWRDDAYSSATASRAVADRFLKDGGVRLRVLAPKDTQAIHLTESSSIGDELEILLSRGAHFRVIKDNGWREVIHPETRSKIRIRDLDVEVIPKEILSPPPVAARAVQRAAVRAQAATIATQRANAALIARVDELVQAKASKAVILHELDPALREAEQLYAGADAVMADALRAAVDTGDATKIRAALTRQSKASGLTPIGRAGAKAKFDPATMEGIGGTKIPDGADVVVVRRGAKVAGIETPEKAVVRLVTPSGPITPAQFDAKIKTAAKGQEALDAAPLDITGRAYGPTYKPDALDRYRVAPEVNGSLRPGGTASQLTADTADIREIDQAFDTSRLTGDIEVWRGLQTGQTIFGPPDTWGSDLAGYEWVDPAYSSTTASDAVAHRFIRPDGVRMRLLVPKGSKAIKLSDAPTPGPGISHAEEAELLLARGARFRVAKDRGWIEVDSVGRKIRIRDLDVEVVVPERTPPISVSRTLTMRAPKSKPSLPRIASTEKTVVKGDFTGLTRVGESLGGNPGGIFEAGDGSRWYVKEAAGPEQARSEALALDLYRAAGLDAPQMIIGQGVEGLGTRQVATRMLDDAKVDLRARLADDPAYIAQVQDGFATDAWLANWDVVGANPAEGKGWDNIVSVADHPVRIEAGGALRYRGLGAEKPFTGDAAEFETLRMRGRAGEVFGGMTPQQIVTSAERVRSVTPAKIKALVKKNGLDPELADTLIARREDILRRAAELAPRPPMTAREFNAAIKAAASRQAALDAVPFSAVDDAAWSDLTFGQQSSISAYRSEGFQRINDALRGVEGMRFSVRGNVDDLDAILDQSRLTSDIELWRSPGSGRSIFGDPATWGDDLAGFEWRDDAYSSASASSGVADRFTKDGGVRLRILTPKGSKAIQLSNMPTRAELADWASEEKEAEILLARGAQYRVVRDRGWTEMIHPTTHQKMRVRDLDIEVIMPEETPPAPWATN